MKIIFIALIITSCGQLSREPTTDNNRPTSIAATESKEQGPKGDKGDKGDTGEQGQKGDDGQDYEYAKNVWVDPMSNREYCIGTTMLVNAFDFYIASMCSAGWHLPTIEEARTAIFHGLLTVTNELWGSSLPIWTSERDVHDGPRFAVISSGSTSTPTGVTLAGVVCLKN